MKHTLSSIKRVARGLLKRPSVFRNSSDYWAKRYSAGHTSGEGSYGRLADFKAEILNAFVVEHDIKTVIEFGCGDGNQLSLAEYPAYIGVDVAQTAIELCRDRFADDISKSFRLADESRGQRADLALSLDVVFHLVEDDVFEQYMTRLFDAAERFVAVYSSNKDEPHPAPHVRHRKFTDWVERKRPEWQLARRVENRYPEGTSDGGPVSFADFYFFQRDRH